MNPLQLNRAYRLRYAYLKYKLSKKVKQRLAVTLCYLSTGDGFSFIALLFMLGASTVRSIIFETCSTICDEMKGQYLKAPDTACNGLLSFPY